MFPVHWKSMCLLLNGEFYKCHLDKVVDGVVQIYIPMDLFLSTWFKLLREVLKSLTIIGKFSISPCSCKAAFCFTYFVAQLGIQYLLEELTPLSL